MDIHSELKQIPTQITQIKQMESVQSEINTIIENALAGIELVSPPPPLETVKINNIKAEQEKAMQLKNQIANLSSNNNNNNNNITIPTPPKQAEQENGKYEHEHHHHHHKRRNNITWESCHSFNADCHICHLNVNDYEKYCQHLKNKHYDIDDSLEWLTCDVCGKMNAHKSNFISHLASHTGRKPFKCRIVLNSGEFCATEASTRQNLQTHIFKVHKLSVKHKLQQNKNKNKSHHSDASKKKKKKKKKKKRKYEEMDEFIADMDVTDPIYGYSYKPRRSKRQKTNRKLSIKQQQKLPYYHPLEILIAAATYVEMNNISIENKVTMTAENMKEAARNWEKILDAQTIQKLKNAADLIDDISTTKQIDC